MHESHISSQYYRIRVKVMIIVSLLLMIVIFRFWPNTYTVPVLTEIIFSDRDIITIDAVVATSHAPAPPVPTAPVRPVNPALPPEVVDVIEEIQEEIDLTPPERAIDAIAGSNTETGTGSGTGNGDEGEGNRGTIVQSPSRVPSVVRIVEPVISEEARKAKIRAEITVRFLVSTDGSVETAHIEEVKIFDPKTNRFEKVNDPGYGIIEASLQAAQRWRFRAAEHGGEKVKAWSRGMFRIGN